MTDVYYDRIYLIVTDYAQQYQSNPLFIKNLFEKYESPVSVMQEFYRKMVATNEMLPIEEYKGKEAIWDEVKDMTCSREKKIKIAQAIYTIDKILNV